MFSALLRLDVFSDCIASVPDALAKLSEEAYGLVLVDVALPGGDPEQIVGRIAELPREARPVVVVVAANPSSARSLDVDVVQIVLRKPIGLRHTVDLIRSCVQGAAMKARPEEPEETDQVTS